MFFVHLLTLAVTPAIASLRPGSAVYGVLQTPPPARNAPAMQFAGVYVPGQGIYWQAQRRSLMQDLSRGLRRIAERVKYTDTTPLRDDCPQDFLYRIFILNKLNAIKHAAKRGLVSLKVNGDTLTVTRNGFLRRLIANRY